MIKKERKKQDKIVLLAKTKLDTIEVLIATVLIGFNISHDKFFVVNVMKEYNDMKETIKNPKSIITDSR